MCPEDIAVAGLAEGQTVTLATDVDDGQDRRLAGLTLTPCKLPRGMIAGSYRECNVLVTIGHHDELSGTPASKSVPVRVEAERGLPMPAAARAKQTLHLRAEGHRDSRSLQASICPAGTTSVQTSPARS